MPRRLLDAVHADLAGIAASALLFGLTFTMSRLTGLERDVPKASPGESSVAAMGGGGTGGSGTGAGGGGGGGDSSGGSPTGAKEATKRAGGTQGQRTYNVILITVDTLRADLGFSGYPRPVSPNIDALAARSVVFDHGYAMASFTPKCLGPLLIGRYIGETKRDYEHYTHFFPENIFLAERVVEGGGHTFGAASHRYFGWKKGFDQGFDIWDTSAIPPNSTDNDPTPTSETLTNVAIAQLSASRAADIPVKASAAAKARTGKAKDRFFTWVHYLDPHLPYVSHEGAPKFWTMATDQKIPKERAPYDGEVWFTDQQLGRFLTFISSQPWANDTVIIFSADHGEAFGEHNHWGHGRELWEPLVHVPFMIMMPGVKPRHIPMKRSHIDVVPTVLDLMGLANEPANMDLHGKSLVSDLTAPLDKIEERDLYIDMPEGPFNEMRRSVITGKSPGLKLIDSGGGKYQLYDLATDPLEQHSIISDTTRLHEATAALARLRATLKEIPVQR